MWALEHSIEAATGMTHSGQGRLCYVANLELGILPT
jgi:hypothetical protein